MGNGRTRTRSTTTGIRQYRADTIPCFNITSEPIRAYPLRFGGLLRSVSALYLVR